MAIVNLKRHYWPHYTEDTFVEVPQEVVDVMEEERRIAKREDSRKRYHHVISYNDDLDCYNHMLISPSPEDMLFEAEEEAIQELILAKLKYALPIAIEEVLSETAKKYTYMFFMENKTITEIANLCGVHKSNVSKAITNAKKLLFRVLKYTDIRLLDHYTHEQRGQEKIWKAIKNRLHVR